MSVSEKTYRNQCIVTLAQLRKVTQQEMASVFDVSQGLVSQICARYAAHGASGVIAKTAPGAPAKLTEEQRARLVTLIEQGAEVSGFEGERWTRARVATLIQQEFGVTYAVSTVGRLLTRLGFSRQTPIRTDHRQSAAAVTAWKTTTLPEIKKRRRQKAV